MQRELFVLEIQKNRNINLIFCFPNEEFAPVVGIKSTESRALDQKKQSTTRDLNANGQFNFVWMYCNSP